MITDDPSARALVWGFRLDRITPRWNLLSGLFGDVKVP